MAPVNSSLTQLDGCGNHPFRQRGYTIFGIVGFSEMVFKPESLRFTRVGCLRLCIAIKHPELVDRIGKVPHCSSKDLEPLPLI